MSDKDNANPTILSLSQLPTRQARKKVLPSGPGTKYRDIIFSHPAYLSGSSDDESDLGGADDMGAGEGDFVEEPIDAQEIYGKTFPSIATFWPSLRSRHRACCCYTWASSLSSPRTTVAFYVGPVELYAYGGETELRQPEPSAAHFTPSKDYLPPMRRGRGRGTGPPDKDHTADVSTIDLISTISDPEHPLSLGQLAVVNLEDIHFTPTPSAADPDALVEVLVEVTPTITHCSLATIIGLGIRVRLEQALPPNYRADVRMKKDMHAQDEQVNKQLADKERVAAALENQDLKRMLDSMLSTCA